MIYDYESMWLVTGTLVGIVIGMIWTYIVMKEKLNDR